MSENPAHLLSVPLNEEALRQRGKKKTFEEETKSQETKTTEESQLGAKNSNGRRGRERKKRETELASRTRKKKRKRWEQATKRATRSNAVRVHPDSLTSERLVEEVGITRHKTGTLRGHVRKVSNRAT